MKPLHKTPDPIPQHDQPKARTSPLSSPLAAEVDQAVDRLRRNEEAKVTKPLRKGGMLTFLR